MYKKDNILFGLVISMLATAATFGVFYLINNIILALIIKKALFSIKFMTIIALGINVLLLRYYLNRNALRTGRGIMVFVFLMAAYVVYTYFSGAFTGEE